MENLPPGFRFYPTEEELVAFYLQNKLEGQKNHINKVIPVVGIYDVEPEQLPELAGEMCRKDTEQWFFFSPRQEREAMGGRPNRTTARGYWKATGSPGYVYSSDNRVIGIKKNMVFYEGKAPCGRKTPWKMNEYRAIEVSESDQSSVATPKLRHEFSLCRVYVISGSFGAFDRRPLEKLTVKSQKHRWDRAAAACPQQNEVMDGTSSFETSHLGGEHSTDFPDAGGSSSTNWNVYNGVDSLPAMDLSNCIKGPLWEWEQFNMV